MEKDIIHDAGADPILCTALDVGSGILRSGGEIQRVEDTIRRICTSLGAEHVEVFTITTLIVASIRMPDGSYSSLNRRITSSSNDLHRLSLYNELSRDICAGELTLDEAQARIREIKHSKPFPDWLNYVAAIFSTGGFTMFFGGDLFDALSASLIGIIITFIERRRPSFVNSVAQTIISSFLSGVLSIFAVKVGLGHNLDKVMIGTIMLVIPGIAIGTSVRELLSGDMVSGSTRFAQSIVIAVVIALAYGASILFMEALPL